MASLPLYYVEIQVEGSQWYVKQNYEHRDAAYEEILHFVHDNDIETDQDSWIKELTAENSLIQASLVAAIDAYYG